MPPKHKCNLVIKYYFYLPGYFGSQSCQACTLAQIVKELLSKPKHYPADGAKTIVTLINDTISASDYDIVAIRV